MHIFFANLRRLIARDAAHVVLGAVMLQIIKDVFIPKLEKDMKKAKSDRQRENVTKKIQQWEKALEPGSKTERTLNAAAANKIRPHVKAMGGNEDDVDEVAQRVAHEALKENKFRQKMGNINPYGTTRDVVSLFSKFVEYRAMSIWRDILRRRSHTENVPDDEEGRSRLEEIPEEKPDKMSHRDVKQFVDSMRKVIKPQVEKHPKVPDWGMVLFDTWMDAIEKKGWSKVSLRSDVYNKMADKGHKYTDAMYSHVLQAIRPMIAQHWEKIIGRLRTDVREKLLSQTASGHREAAERIAYEELMLRTALWVFGPLSELYRR